MNNKEKFEIIKNEIINDPSNLEFTNKGWLPLYSVSEKSKIIIVGQAPGIKTQLSSSAWNDLSGNTLRSWLGVTREEFYNPDNFGQIPMDFYFPGKGRSGDLPPRKDFAPKWHQKFLDLIPDYKLIILIGSYAQKYYLKENKSLTEIVKSYENYLPHYFPLAHPSPLNIRWMVANPWFEKDVIPSLKKIITNILK